MSAYTKTTFVEGSAPGISAPELNKIGQGIADNVIPTGLISMWSGAIAPDGWVLCNGLNGTPDLRDRFIVGAGSTYAADATGGASTVALSTVQLPSHLHGSGTLTTSLTGQHAHTYDTKKENIVVMEGTGDYDAAYNEEEVRTTDSAGNHSHAITGSTSSIGSGSAHENKPPYYALAFIMKL